MFWKNEREKWIPVMPKNYRSIALRAIEISSEPHVYINKQETTDFSERGNLTQDGIRSLIDFKVTDGKKTILGFHDHPDQMYITEQYANFAQYCHEQGWLKIEGSAS